MPSHKEYKQFSDGPDYDSIENYEFVPVRQATKRAERITINLFGNLSKTTFTTNSINGIVNKLCRVFFPHHSFFLSPSLSSPFTHRSFIGIMFFVCLQLYLLRMYACQGLCCFPSTSAFGFVIESINETESDTTRDGGSARVFYTVDEKTEVFISGVTGSTKPAEQQVVPSEARSGAGSVKAKGGVTEVGGLDSIYSQLLGIIQDPVVHADVLAMSTSFPS